MPDPPPWIRIGNRIPRVATLSIGLLALFGLSVIRLVLVMAPRDQDVVANGYLDGTAAGILWLGCAICLAVCAAAVAISIAARQ